MSRRLRGHLICSTVAMAVLMWTFISVYTRSGQLYNVARGGIKTYSYSTNVKSSAVSASQKVGL